MSDFERKACGSCDAPIIWASTVKGRPMPVDAEPDPDGNILLEPMLTPAQVAKMLRVNPKTVTRWAAAGKLASIRTPGGHRRFRESAVRALLESES